MRTLLAAVLMTFASGVLAQEWRGLDYALLGGALGMYALDWGQTRDIATRRNTSTVCVTTPQETVCQSFSTPVYTEVGPLLPKHPTVNQVDRHFALAMAGTTGLALLLPEQPRRIFLGGTILWEAYWVNHNRSVGLHVSF
jgi:hypothetical protein